MYILVSFLWLRTCKENIISCRKLYLWFKGKPLITERIPGERCSISNGERTCYQLVSMLTQWVYSYY